MVVDFSEIKRVVSRWIDENLDHRMILDGRPGGRNAAGHGRAAVPDGRHPTAENIAKLIFETAARSTDFRWWKSALGDAALLCDVSSEGLDEQSPLMVESKGSSGSIFGGGRRRRRWPARRWPTKPASRARAPC